VTDASGSILVAALNIAWHLPSILKTPYNLQSSVFNTLVYNIHALGSRFPIPPTSLLSLASNRNHVSGRYVLGRTAHSEVIAISFYHQYLPETTSNANDRTITAATVLISIPGHVLGIPDFYYVAFIPQYVFTLRMVPQIWRLVSNFFITGPKLGMILDPYFLFTYCSNLETTAARFSQPGDFFMYLGFCCVVILVRWSSL
jgi:hypothetical protein